ncbi:MAG TPA: hypothetical protein VGE11_03100 [Pseudonocardia sp.]
MTDVATVRNNAEWCEAVCRTHGRGGVFTRWAWTSRRRTPALYPDAVTLLPATGVADVLKAIDLSEGCSVKDSFARLDLSADGFEPIIEAQWIDRPAALSMPPAPSPFWTVASVGELAEWAIAWNGGPADLFRAQLLDEPAVRVLAARRNGVIIAGAIAYDSGPVTGVSNLFAVDGDLDDAWAGVLCALPGRRVVGYGTGGALAAAVRVGFARAGPLRVWQRTPSASRP